jgi:twinkle protein
MIDGAQVKDMLNERAEAFCAWLFPAGRRDGGNFCIGNLDGQPGKSLAIGIQGNKIGVWKDFATGEGGTNLLELLIQSRKLEFKPAMDEAKKWLGVHEPTGMVRHRPVPTETAVPVGGPKKKLQCPEVQEGSAVWNWLTEERQIRPEAIRAYKIGAARFTFKDAERDFIVFPFYDTAGNLVRLKYRDIRDKACMFQKPSLAEAPGYEHGYQKLLFGWQAVNPKRATVGLCEGEIDAMTLWGSGALPTLSLPEGAQAKKDNRPENESPHDQWMTHDHDALADKPNRLVSLVARIKGQGPKVHHFNGNTLLLDLLRVDASVPRPGRARNPQRVRPFLPREDFVNRRLRVAVNEEWSAKLP